MRLSFDIAWRFLKKSGGQTFLIVAGISIGVAIQIFIGLLIQSLQINLIEDLIGNSPHIILKAKDNYIKDYKNIIEEFRIYDDITFINESNVEPLTLVVNDENFNMIMKGINFEEGYEIYDLKEKIDTDLNEEGIYLGASFKDEYGLKVGDDVEFFVVKFRKLFKAKIVGFFDFDNSNLNSSWMIASNKYMSSLFDYDNNFSIIEMQIDKPLDVELIYNSLINDNNINYSDLELTNWKLENESFVGGLNGQSASSLIIQIFVIVSVALAISSVLTISVLQKSKEIGILKAMGINDNSASFIFIYQGFLLGVIGAIVGLIFAFLLLWMFSTFAINSDGSPVVKITINYFYISLSVLIAIFSSTIASVIAARKSSKLSPIEVIKNG